METALTEHLSHEKNAPEQGTNTHNGYTSKTLLSDGEEFEMNTPRDREGSLSRN